MTESSEPEKQPEEKKSKGKELMEKGPQPLNALLISLNINNTDLVSKSTEQLTYKMLAKGRSGRRLTWNGRMKILNALNKCQTEKVYTLADLFNYQGK